MAKKVDHFSQAIVAQETLAQEILTQQIFTQQISEARRRAQELVSGLTPGQLSKRPHPAKWSIAECLAHLNVTAATVQSLMRKAIERGRLEKKFGDGPFEIGAKGRLLIWLAEPPPKVRLPAPRLVRPPARIDDPMGLLATFLKAQDEWEKLMRESQGLDQGRIKFGSLTSPFRARLCAAIPWMMAHQRRHLLQAENVKRQIVAATAARAAARAS
jgi:DinB superfamily